MRDPVQEFVVHRAGTSHPKVNDEALVQAMVLLDLKAEVVNPEEVGQHRHQSPTRVIGRILRFMVED